MAKTDKELTTEIVVAMINANRRDMNEKTAFHANALNCNEVVNLINSVYQTINRLEQPKGNC